MWVTAQYVLELLFSGKRARFVAWRWCLGLASWTFFFGWGVGCEEMGGIKANQSILYRS